MHDSSILLAFSGGLDTSFCVPWLKENYNKDIITATIDTGGLDDDARNALKEKSMALGAKDHILIDARNNFFNDTVKYLIFGNIKKGHMYPLCVGAERAVQAIKLSELANNLGVKSIAHGCTAAGNDQVRFEVILSALSPDIELLAPIRDQAWQRKDQINYLEERKLPVPTKGSSYSINRGLWGVTIGGKETLTSQGSIPESEWYLSANALLNNQPEETHTITFDKGIPVAIDQKKLNIIELIELLDTMGAKFGVGRGIHLGDTIIQTKGRVAFEAPAAEIIIQTHRELEKLVLSSSQIKIKELIALNYVDLIHEGKNLDPVCADIECFLASSQSYVSGEISFNISPGRLFITGVDSPYSLMKASKSKYGESASEWTPNDAKGFTKIQSLSGIFLQRARK